MRYIHACLALAMAGSAGIVRAQIGAKIQQQGELYGIWQNGTQGFQMKLVLNSDGTGEFDGDAIKFTHREDKLAIDQHGKTTAYLFKVQSDALTLAGGDLTTPLTFTRARIAGAAQPPATPIAKPAAPAAPAANPNAKPPAPASKAGTADPLIGVWSGNGETIEFGADGRCHYLGQTYPYHRSQGHVVLQTPQGALLMAYSIQGSQLALVVNGKSLIYTATSAPMPNTAAPAVGPAKGGRQVAADLVGKWSYVNVTTTNTGGVSSEEYIILQANGTYQFRSERSMSATTGTFSTGTSSQGNDSGAWWVEGERIFYRSPTRGDGSFKLQRLNHPKTGDPMIVLDGTAYVSYHQRAPWR